MRIQKYKINLMHTGLLFAFVTLTANADLNTNQFREVTEQAGITTSVSPETWGQGVGDIDNDGFPDVFLGNHGWTPTTVWHNKGDGTFEDVIDNPAMFGEYEIDKDSHSLMFVDFNNDGEQEIIEVSGASWDNEVFIKDENGVYQVTPSGPDGLGFRYDEWRAGRENQNPSGRRAPLFFDFDKDGLLDALIGARVAGSTSYTGNTALFRQTTNAQGGPTFEFVDETLTDLDISTPSACRQLQLHDLSGDGKLDVVCLDYSRLTAVWDISDTPPYLRDLRPQIGEELFQRWPYDMAIGDFNGDGRNDVFITTRTNYKNLAAQVDARTVLARLGEQGTGFSFAANGNVTFEFGAYTQPPQIFIGSTAWSPPWRTDIGAGLDVSRPGNRVLLTLSAADSENFGLASDRSERGAYIGFVNGRWQVVLNIRATREPTISAKAGTMVSGSITDLRSEPAGAVALEQGPLSTGTRLYLGNESGQYVDWGTQSRLTQYRGSCVTVVAGDFDNDMDLDAYVGCTGNVGNLENVLFDNQGDGTFTQVADAGGAKGDYVGMQPRLENLGRVDAVMTLDYDRDGCLDLFVTNGLYPRPFSASGINRLYRNECSGNWAEIKLVGVDVNRDGIGAVVYATTPDGKTQMREQGGATHHDAQNDTMIHIGLAQNPWVNVRVVWPDGQEDFYDALEINQVHTLTQGGGSSVPVPRISIADVAVDESAGPADFVVTLSSSSTDVVSVAYETTDGTATLADSDYTLTSGTLIFPAGETVQHILVPINDDANPEDAETFTVTLNTPANATILNESASGTIAANDGFGGGGGYVLSVGNVTVNENAGTAEFIVNLSPAVTGETVVVNFTTANDTAAAPDDFTFKSGTLDFTDGGLSQLSVSVDIVNDEDAEPTQIFLLQLSSVDTDPVSATGTILDNDSGPTPVCGQPDFDKRTETGVILWNDCADPQQWHARMLAGGQTVSYQGSVTSDGLFDSLTGFSIDSSDSLPADFNIPTAGPIDFTLNVMNTWWDGFEFHFPASANVCFDLTSPALPVWVGANRIPASGPVNLTNFGEACLTSEVPSTPQCGEPDFDKRTETGVFLWNDCADPQQWHARMSAGGQTVSYQGSLTSDGLFDSLTGFSIDGSDSLPDNFNTPTAGPIDFTLNVMNTWWDGFEFHFPASANVCFDLTSPALPVRIGSNRIEATGPVNLTTFGACAP